jgi:large subunit ribosomal protein L21
LRARALARSQVIVFKKKRRKGYRKWNGFRRQLTMLRIQDVVCPDF